MRQFGTAVTLLILIASCDTLRVYELNNDLDGKLWHVDSLQSFAFEIPDADIGYNIFINVRNTSSYPYHNLYLTYILSDSSERELASELVSNNLFDPVSGKPLGSSGLGDVFDHQILILDDYKFLDTGRYLFSLQQTMRLDSLPEIISTGIRVERVQ